MKLSHTTTAAGATAGIGCFILSAQLVVVGLIATGLAFWTERNLEFWLSHFKGVPVDVPWWLALLASLIAPVTFALNVIAEIARLCI